MTILVTHFVDVQLTRDILAAAQQRFITALNRSETSSLLNILSQNFVININPVLANTP